jgi:TM2 domain-containing membrane protein YozV
MAGKQAAIGGQTAPVKPYSITDLVLLSAFIPGTGQFANGQRNKGLFILIPSAILFVDAVVHTFIIALRIAAPVMEGEKLVIDNEVYLNFQTLLIVLGLAMALWLYALVDTIVVAKGKKAAEAGE